MGSRVWGWPSAGPSCSAVRICDSSWLQRGQSRGDPNLGSGHKPGMPEVRTINVEPVAELGSSVSRLQT